MTTETLSEIQVSYKPGLTSSKIVNSSKEAFDILATLFPQDTICLQEQFVVLYLNRANRVIGSYQLSKGGITGTIADVRLILDIPLHSTPRFRSKVRHDSEAKYASIPRQRLPLIPRQLRHFVKESVFVLD